RCLWCVTAAAEATGRSVVWPATGSVEDHQGPRPAGGSPRASPACVPSRLRSRVVSAHRRQSARGARAPAARGRSDDDGVYAGHAARATAGRQRLRQAGELNGDSDPDTAGSKFEWENCLRNRAGGPNGIRTRVSALRGPCPGPLDDGAVRGVWLGEEDSNPRYVVQSHVSYP